MSTFVKLIQKNKNGIGHYYLDSVYTSARPVVGDEIEHWSRTLKVVRCVHRLDPCELIVFVEETQ